MRHCWAMLLASVFTVTAIAPVAAQQCPPPQQVGLAEPVISVQTVVPQPRYRFDVSRDQLTRLMSQKGSNGGQHGSVLGLTYGTYNARWSVQANAMKVSGGYCHYLQNADVRLEIPELTVYVAREYRRGSCQYQVISQHENEHVRVNQYVIQKYSPVMRTRLNSAAKRLLPLRSTESNPATAIERALNPVLTEVLQQMYGERDRANAGIDSAYQYKITAQRCQSW